MEYRFTRKHYCFWVLIHVVFVGVLESCLEEERLGLLSIRDYFKSINGDLNRLSTSEALVQWVDDPAADCCSWVELTCNNASMVTQITLFYLLPSMTGSQRVLNMSLFTPFKELLSLDLSSNGFTDLYQNHELGGLQKLEILDLGDNGFFGDVFHSLGNMTSLKALSLARNKLNGSFTQQGLCELKNLQEFYLGNNDLSGTIPPCLGNLTSLRILDLSFNRLEGDISSSPIFNLKDFQYIDLTDNLFEGLFSFYSIANFTNLKWLMLSSHNHKLEVQTHDSYDWKPTFQLKFLVLSKCKLDSIPQFLVHQTDLRAIDLSHNNLTGAFPNWLLENNTKLELLDLSDNHITGPIPFSIGHMAELQYLDLSNNRFSGEIATTLVGLANFSNLITSAAWHNKLDGQIPNSFNMTSLRVLQLSGNQITGNLSSWISHHPSLWFLGLSDNNITGEIPSELARLELHYLDLSHNFLSGPIPSCFNLLYLEHFNLEGNRLTGSIPETLLNSSSILTLNIGNNLLSGRIPSSVGDLLNLRVLLLGRNSLGGLLPDQLCQLNQLGILDLSHNSFSGPIPRCLGNISFGKLTSLSFAKASVDISYNFLDNATLNWGKLFYSASELVGEIQQRLQVEFVTKARPNIYEGSILNLMSGLDLSCNQLRGEIPAELGTLSSMHALNLSHNQLTGFIPTTFAKLKEIESLDLSHNKLSGEIPSELIGLNFLEFFVVAHNNLSGRLPDMKGQFGTFPSESYEGNPFLCGPPLASCNVILDVPQLTPSNTDASEEKWYDIDPMFFIASFIPSYLVFLVAFALVFYINLGWRRRLFLFIDNLMDKCYFLVFYTVPKLFAAFYR